jgi:exosortase
MEDSATIRRLLTTHHLWFVLFSIFALVTFRAPLSTLVSLSLQDDRYSYVLLIPIICASLVYLERRAVFASPRYCLSIGAPLLAGGVALFTFVQIRLFTLSPIDHLSIVVLSIVFVLISGFVICYGLQSFRCALFPLLFLLLMVPMPAVALDNTVLALQKGSAVMTYALYKLLGVPVLWQHFKFLLPGVEIEIAKECSGIRSSSALFITSLIAGHLFLQSGWRRAFFSFFTIPVVIFKNAVRIVTISCLGVYVDPAFLHGKLHRYGGLPFSLISLAILVPLLLMLQKGECRRSESVRAQASSQSVVESDPAVLNSAFD